MNLPIRLKVSSFSPPMSSLRNSQPLNWLKPSLLSTGFEPARSTSLSLVEPGRGALTRCRSLGLYFIVCIHVLYHADYRVTSSAILTVLCWYYLLRMIAFNMWLIFYYTQISTSIKVFVFLLCSGFKWTSMIVFLWIPITTYSLTTPKSVIITVYYWLICWCGTCTVGK